MAQVVRCLKCGKIYSGRDALDHVKFTGHNNWELMMPAINKGGKNEHV